MLRTAEYNGRRLDALENLRYSTYVSSGGSSGTAPFLWLDVDYNGDNSIDDVLFFEPAYQEAAFFPSNPQGRSRWAHGRRGTPTAAGGGL